ncbi:unnamed protein product [Rotaria socialis]|uniref:Uncharacterized protein n=1 Tax=Rotaria socialis TaxID=392032 RepID=A0A821FTU8_9BILA|nr:unnamed protein product [Rotaria socialis]
MTLSMKFIIKLNIWNHGGKRSRKTSGLIGTCGGARGVGGGGILSTPFCILYKLYTRKSTRKQAISLTIHTDSSYIVYSTLDVQAGGDCVMPMKINTINIQIDSDVTLMANDKVPHRNRKHRSYRFRSPAISDIRFCRDLS